MKLLFFADGVPAPGGSKTAFALCDKAGKLVIKTNPKNGRESPVLMYSDAGVGNKEWRKIVGWRAKSAMQHAGFSLFTGRLRLTIEFLMPRGKTVTRPDHIIAPDLSKLIRSTEDAMTGIVWEDDCLITDHGPMKKRYVLPGEKEGAHIMVETLAIEEQLALAPAPSKVKPPAPSPKPPAKDPLTIPAFDDADSPFD